MMKASPLISTDPHLFQQVETMLRRFFNQWKSAWISGALALFAFAAGQETRAAGWAESAWARANTFRATQTFWATSHSIIYTQHLGTNAIISTNRFLFNISPTNFNPYPITNTFGFIIPDVGTNGAASNQLYSVTDVRSLAQTNLLLNWRAQIKWDATFATAERIAGSGSASNTAAGVRFYFDDRAQLAYLKSELDARTLNRGWIAPAAFSNAIAATNYSTSASYVWAFGGSDTNRDINRAAGVGTNFISYTPTADLFFTNSQFRRVMTCAVYIASGSANVTTTLVSDCCGGFFDAIGTNGQRVVNVCTNLNIDPGLDASAFNYYALRRVITNYNTRLIVSAGDWHNWQATHSTNLLYDYTQGVVFTNHQTYVAETWDRAIYHGNELTSASATDTVAILIGGGTNVFAFANPPLTHAAAVDLRAAGQKVTRPFAGTYDTNLIYYAWNTGIAESPAGAPAAYLAFSVTNWSGVINLTNTPSMADWPALVVANVSGDETFRTATRGYSLANGMSALVWFYGLPTNAPDAFRFR